MARIERQKPLICRKTWTGPTSMKNASIFGRWYRMSEKTSSLEVLSNSLFQRREFIFERMGWLVMGLILLAAALGLFGKGMLSRAVLETEQFSLQYDRFLHYGNLTTLKIDVPANGGDVGVVAVAMPNSYLHQFRIEKIVPEPESTAHGNQTVFWFTATSADEPISILFRIEPEQVGKMEGQIFVNSEQGYAFKQFVYP